MKPHKKKNSIVKKFKHGVCGSWLQVLGPTIRTNLGLGLPNQQLPLWTTIQLSRKSTSNCCKAKSLMKEWTFEQVKVFTNGIKYPYRNPHMESSSLHKLCFVPCLVSKIPCIWIVQH